MLKLAIVARHGLYDGSNSSGLSEAGISQMERLAEDIFPLVNNRPVGLFTSTAKRAIHSMDIIATKLGIETKTEVPLLYHDSYPWGTRLMEVMLESIKDDIEVIVTVGHFEAPSGMIDAFALKYCGKTVIGKAKALHYGTAFVLDLSSGELKTI